MPLKLLTNRTDMTYISSSGTFFWKYIFPWTLIIFSFSIGFFFLIEGEYVFFIIITLISGLTFGIFKFTLMRLSTIQLDKLNRVIIVDSNKLEMIDFSDIIDIYRFPTSPQVAKMTLRKRTSFGDSILFIPSGFPIFFGLGKDPLLKSIKE